MTKWLSRSTIFAGFFAVTAFILALKGLLTGQYVAIVTALHVSVTGRAIAEDYHERNAKERNDDPAPAPKADNPDA
jgi:hypothetical protein